jgi:hypothetical protein
LEQCRGRTDLRDRRDGARRVGGTARRRRGHLAERGQRCRRGRVEECALGPKGQAGLVLAWRGRRGRRGAGLLAQALGALSDTLRQVEPDVVVVAADEPRLGAAFGKQRASACKLEAPGLAAALPRHGHAVEQVAPGAHRRGGAGV